METIEDLKRRIKSTEDLQSVVKTMKAMAAVKIHQYEQAVESLQDYSRTIELGLRAVLRNRPEVMVGARSSGRSRPGSVVFGSDQGMCGQLNDQVVSHALKEIEAASDADSHRLLAVGQRAAARLEEGGESVEGTLSTPGSIQGVVPKVQDLLTRIQDWNQEGGVDQVFLYHSRPLSGARYEPRSVHLLPVDRSWLAEIRKKEWPTRALPLFTMDWDPMFSSLIRQYLFVSLFQAFAESLASENASRLASMQGAEKNIREQLDDLVMKYHQQRQMSITEELLDIISGFEALDTSA
ncbi:MAG: F0F1 ATP synthase subunit gamma [Desulfatiglandaceae bacterium]